MSWYQDLAPIDYFDFPGRENSLQLRAVGWLDSDWDYSHYELLPGFVQRLVGFLANPWQPGVSMGSHQCEFCRLSGGPANFRLVDSNEEISIGWANVFIPGDGFLYVAPSLILHYMDAHNYGPPEEFQRAVLACPEMRSMEYLKAIKKNGPPGLWKSSAAEAD